MFMHKQAGYIYKITNISNGKIYIGQTWQQIHIRCSHPNKYKNCIKLYRAFNKYGFDNFKVEVITTAFDQSTLDDLESFFIQKYNCIESGYNCQAGGSNGKHSESTKQKMSEAWLKRPGPSAETKNLISKALIGRTYSAETKKKMSLRKRGENTHTAKLTWDKVSKIRSDFEAGGLCQKDLAAQYGVNTSTINRILRHKTWILS
jgi:group I intron endonuclease